MDALGWAPRPEDEPGWLDASLKAPARCFFMGLPTTLSSGRLFPRAGTLPKPGMEPSPVSPVNPVLIGGEFAVKAPRLGDFWSGGVALSASSERCRLSCGWYISCGSCGREKDLCVL